MAGKQNNTQFQKMIAFNNKGIWRAISFYIASD